MPIYEYTCSKCQDKFDHLARSMTAANEAKVPCPKCGSTQTARKFSVFAVGAEGQSPSSGPAPMCGSCGGAPGSCMSR